MIGKSELTEFEVKRILFQLLTARLIENAPEERGFRPVFLDVEDSPELLKVISTYNDMFGRLYDALLNAVGEEPAREIVMTAMQNAESDELWSGVCLWLRPGDWQCTWQERSLVRMKPLTDAEIDAYLKTRKWEGCSGAYAIELPHDPYLTVEEGSVSNVIGLPMESLAKAIAWMAGVRKTSHG